MAPKQQPTVLLTNDDGPPCADSPYIFGLYKYLTRILGWDVRVVIPSSQKSWIGSYLTLPPTRGRGPVLFLTAETGKAYLLNEVVRGRFYYPRDPDGAGEFSDFPRALKEGEIGEWILLDGTPASCSNIALHNLYPGEIDLLLSGPNLGRNTSSAFALSSGTLGAALSSSLSQMRSIGLSYGTMERPTPHAYFEPAHALAAKIIRHLWENWGQDEEGLRNGEIDLYTVNIPMIRGLLSEEGLPIVWTRLWRNSYHRLFKAHTLEHAAELEREPPQAGPDSTKMPPTQTTSQGAEGVSPKKIGGLIFNFSPDMTGLLDLQPSSLPEGSDAWAVEKGWVSVTPLRASLGEPPAPGGAIQDRVWKMKL